MKIKVQDLSLLPPDQKIKLILLQAEEINLLKESISQLKLKIKALEERKSKNSRNSSKPPSTRPFRNAGWIFKHCPNFKYSLLVK